MLHKILLTNTAAVAGAFQEPELKSFWSVLSPTVSNRTTNIFYSLPECQILTTRTARTFSLSLLDTGKHPTEKSLQIWKRYNLNIEKMYKRRVVFFHFIKQFTFWLLWHLPLCQHIRCICNQNCLPLLFSLGFKCSSINHKDYSESGMHNKQLYKQNRISITSWWSSSSEHQRSRVQEKLWDAVLWYMYISFAPVTNKMFDLFKLVHVYKCFYIVDPESRSNRGQW